MVDPAVQGMDARRAAPVEEPPFARLCRTCPAGGIVWEWVRWFRELVRLGGVVVDRVVGVVVGKISG